MIDVVELHGAAYSQAAGEGHEAEATRQPCRQGQESLDPPRVLVERFFQLLGRRQAVRLLHRGHQRSKLVALPVSRELLCAGLQRLLRERLARSATAWNCTTASAMVHAR